MHYIIAPLLTFQFRAKATGTYIYCYSIRYLSGKRTKDGFFLSFLPTLYVLSCTRDKMSATNEHERLCLISGISLYIYILVFCKDVNGMQICFNLLHVGQLDNCPRSDAERYRSERPTLNLYQDGRHSCIQKNRVKCSFQVSYPSLPPKGRKKKPYCF